MERSSLSSQLDFVTQLFVDAFIEFRSGKRIGNRNSDVVGTGLADQLNGLLDIIPGFARITELKKEAGADSVGLQAVPGVHQFD